MLRRMQSRMPCSGNSPNSLRVLQTNLCAPKGNSDTNMERSLLFIPCVTVVPSKLFASRGDIHSTGENKP